MKTTNQLKNQTSPYLLQHAENPVNWYPWGEEALNLAKQQNKPILLSIGYSACHWCHVMAHESFEDEATARLMNELYINIKVDREERPDLDKIYQLAHQFMTGRNGGWPLTVFLTPEQHVPYYAGTYFPKGAKNGMPSFESILQQLGQAYIEHKSEIDQQAIKLYMALNTVNQHGASEEPISEAIFLQSIEQLKQNFDTKYGGFGSEPKFPDISNIERLLHHGVINKDQQSLKHATLTLDNMAQGGMNDLLSGGFYRYSVDQRWVIPHFEKMLYDNAVILAEYAQAYSIDQSPLYLKTTETTTSWVIKELQVDHGGYCSSFNADSEGKEGTYYVWQPEAVKALLTTQEYELIEPHFGLDQPANFEGQWHFHTYKPLNEINANSAQDNEALFNSACTKLLAARELRIKPDRDDKILTSWNGLMIRAMALTARYCNNSEALDSASKAAEFIRNNQLVDGRLLATYKDGRSHLMAYLDDYAFLLDGLLELLQVRWKKADYDLALQLADALLNFFEDQEQGGFWFVAHDHETLVQRPKTYHDEAIPSGNAIAAFALQRLGYLTGNTDYIESAHKTLLNSVTSTTNMPSAHCAILKAAHEHINQPICIIIVTNNDAIGQEWLNLCNQQYAPFQQSYCLNTQQELPEAIANKPLIGEVTAYICQGMQCQLAITDKTEFQNKLSQLQNNG